MKLSLAWIFDHLDADWRSIDVPALVKKLNETTAEIEAVHRIELPSDALLVAQVVDSVAEKQTTVSMAAGQRMLPYRADVQVGDYFFVQCTDTAAPSQVNAWRWATSIDLGATKDFVLPNVHTDSDSVSAFEYNDYVLEVDNKSLTHRPDLWGHRGFAREIGAILNIPLKSLDRMCVDVAKNDFRGIAASKKLPTQCTQLATLSIDVAGQKSSIPMALRLARIDARPINLIVDCTNYVMFDLGHPMHAFDQEKINGTLAVRMAHPAEKLRLLDGQLIELTSHDLVIADDSKAISLAGIMGGYDTGITEKTTQVLLEAACFDPATIRRSCVRYKKRTDASARFEKSLDPLMPTYAIERFMALLKAEAVSYTQNSSLEVYGIVPSTVQIAVHHQFIEKQLGVAICPEFVCTRLRALGFDVHQQTHANNAIEYAITVPSFRATKDISIAVDIVEEVGRCYGFDNIAGTLPKIVTTPHLHRAMHTTRKIKQLLAYGMQMRELQSYAFFDEQFLRECHFEPTDTVAVQQPVSENWRRLVTSLVPNLIKAVVANSVHHDALRFFELNRIWDYEHMVVEKQSLAGIFFDKKKPVDFYASKLLMQSVLSVVDKPVRWEQQMSPAAPWYAPYQTAELYVGELKIGLAGVANHSFWQQCALGHAFIFELSVDALLALSNTIKQAKPLCPYPFVVRDVSMLVPISVTADQLIDLVTGIDKTIRHVELVDFYQQEEWKDQRSITLRVTMQDEHATMSANQIDQLHTVITTLLINRGATIR